MYISSSNINGINGLQLKILQFANIWAKKERTPVPQDEIINEMKKTKESPATVVGDLYILRKKGYIEKVKIYGDTHKYFKLLR